MRVDDGVAADERTDRSRRAARWAFGAYAVAAIPLLVFVLGRFHWFMRDDWHFITDREVDSAQDLFAAHNGHWSTVPVIAFRALWAVFGIRTYLPYQLVVVALHIGVVVLLRVVMRRAGVGPWLATAAAGALVLFGPGRQDIVWAFQIGLTGAVFFALAQLVLADHDGAVDRRDVAGLLAGVLAIMSAGTAVPVVVATGITLAVRRGWRRALLHTVPLAVMYVVWSTVVDAGVGSEYGRPDLRTVIDWVRDGYAGVLQGLGHHTPVVWALAVLLVAGLALLATDRDGHRLERVRCAAGPIALLFASLLFMLLTVQARWVVDPDGARAGRYVYIGAVLVAPAVAVAANEVARRWRSATPVLIALLLGAIPWNVAMFGDPPFGVAYHERNRSLVRSVVRLPEVRELRPETRPLWDPNIPEELDLGFLVQAVDGGKLVPSSDDIPEALENELVVRLHLQQRGAGEALALAGVDDLEELPGRCRQVDAGQDLEPSTGTVYLWDGALGGLRLSAVGADGPVGPAVTIRATDGNALVAQNGGGRFDWEPAGAGASFDLCELAPAAQTG